MIRRGMSQREAVKVLMIAGYSIQQKKGHGEFIIRHPKGGKPIVLHSQRKDIPSEVVHLVSRLERMYANG